MPKYFRFITLLLTLCCAIAEAEPLENGPRYDVSVWSAGVEGKLPKGEVVAITQARNGYLWLGTLGGLARFDGRSFKVFKQMNTPGLNDDQIIRLFEDSRSNLWVGTASDGVILIKDGKVQSLGIGRGSKDEHLMSACEDSLGAVWLYTADGQLFRNYQGQTMHWQVPPSASRSIVAEKDGLVWISTDRKLYGINPKSDLSANHLGEKIISMPLGLQFLFPSQKGGFWVLGSGRVQKWQDGKPLKDYGPFRWSKQALSGCEDQDGNLIVGTLGDGIWWFDSKGGARHLTSEQDNLSHNYILSLAMDHEGSLWVGTDGGGLDRVRRQPFNVLAGTEAITVQSACEDASGALWLNTRDGVRRYQDSVLTTFSTNEGLANINGQSVFVDKKQNVWAGSVGSSGTGGQSLFKLNRKTNRFEAASPEVFGGGERDVSVLFQDHAGNLWVGSQGGGLARWDGKAWKIFTKHDGLTSDEIQSMGEDSQGVLWIGTSAGLNRFKDGVFTAIHSSNGLPGENVSSVLVDAQDVVWVGTLGRGLGRLQNGKWTLYSTKQGLLNDSLGYLLEDALGNLWIGSSSGLLRTRKEELNQFALGQTNAFACYAYGEENGLSTGECTDGSQPGACRSTSLGSDGRLWFPTIRGLATVDPAQLRRNTNAPPVVIESVLVSDELQNTNPLSSVLPDVITVPAGKESIDVHYTSLNLSTADRAKFKYRMEGYETAWHKVGSIRVASYTKLTPGSYLFRVCACNEDDVWNETGATLAFTVLPPFWRTPWFITLSVLVLVGIIAGVVHFLSTQRLQKQLEGLRQQQALEKERARIARDIHDQLGASMTQISMLGEMVESDKNEPAEVESHAQQITQTARDTSRVLDEIVWTVNPSNDTLEGLINYICKYAQEYFAVADVRYRLEVPSQLPDNGIYPEVRHNVFLAAKESITNVVKHAKATEVKLRLIIQPGRFILEIQDNGKGPINLEGKESRNGLRNMRRRMEDVGGTFELVAAPEGGAIARLTVPIKNL